MIPSGRPSIRMGRTHLASHTLASRTSRRTRLVSCAPAPRASSQTRLAPHATHPAHASSRASFAPHARAPFVPRIMRRPRLALRSPALRQQAALGGRR
jgi:hypothetical protein